MEALLQGGHHLETLAGWRTHEQTARPLSSRFQISGPLHCPSHPTKLHPEMAVSLKCSPGPANQTSTEAIFLPRTYWKLPSSTDRQFGFLTEGVDESPALNCMTSSTGVLVDSPCYLVTESDATKGQLYGLSSLNAPGRATLKRRSWQEALASAEPSMPRAMSSDCTVRLEEVIPSLEYSSNPHFCQTATTQAWSSLLASTTLGQAEFHEEPLLEADTVGNFQLLMYDTLQQSLENDWGLPLIFGELLPGTQIEEESQHFASPWNDPLLVQQIVPSRGLTPYSTNKITHLTNCVDDNIVGAPIPDWQNCADDRCAESSVISKVSGSSFENLNVGAAGLSWGKQIQDLQLYSDTEKSEPHDGKKWSSSSLNIPADDLGLVGDGTQCTSKTKDASIPFGKDRSLTSCVTFGETSCKSVCVENANLQAESRKRPLEESSLQSINAACKRSQLDSSDQCMHSSKKSSSWTSLRGGKAASKPGCSSSANSKSSSQQSSGVALNTTLKPRARQGSATDPQSIAARNRRERINARLKILQELVPNGSKVDLVTMLEKAINYVKFLQLQLKVLTNDEYWPSQKEATHDNPSSNDGFTAATTFDIAAATDNYVCDVLENNIDRNL